MTKAERKRLCDSCRAKFPGKTPSWFGKQLKKQRKEKQEQERLTKKGETARIREAVVERAGNQCEAAAYERFWPHLREHGMQLDHWLGGWGRRRQKQCVENTWLLCPPCHRERTVNAPSAAYWNNIFRQHCAKYGYPFTPHIEHERAARSAPKALAISSARESR